MRATRAWSYGLTATRVGEDVCRRGGCRIESKAPGANYQYNDQPETAFWTNNTRTVSGWCSATGQGVASGGGRLGLGGAVGRPGALKFKDRKGKSSSGLILQSSYDQAVKNRHLAWCAV